MLHEKRAPEEKLAACSAANALAPPQRKLAFKFLISQPGSVSKPPYLPDPLLNAFAHLKNCLDHDVCLPALYLQ